jgi:hypothetical protein|uniref:Uncharacterized protein n=1 Tax=uncultured bacterium BAC17H8 TaxID=332980 RepID=Q4JMM2_9BACT|nr:unknown [uncultured bacterium BAC17H8]
MTEKWQQTDLIVMAVQTAELRQAGVREKPRLNLSCSLVNIARGQCMLEVSAGQVSDNSEVGELVIEIDRPVMQGVITIPQPLYDALLNCLYSAPPRPISLSLTIATRLAVSLEGDLRINDKTSVNVLDLAVNLPLK